MGKPERSRIDYRDLLAILALIALQPAIYYLDQTRARFPADAIQYMVFARDFLSQGLLYVEYGLAGQGSVLPPVYPFLTLLGSVFGDDMFSVAEHVSRVAAIATSLIFYTVVRRWMNPYLAVSVVLAVQVNYEFVLFAVTPLTEASFILSVACVLWLTLLVISTEARSTLTVFLGVLLAACFLTRQIGILVVPFVVLIILVASPRRFLNNGAAILIGMAILLSPYVAALHFQAKALGADVSAIDQHWSARAAIPLSEVDSQTQEYIRWLDNQPTPDYVDVLRKRRLLRQLLPDSSAMLSQVELTPPDEAQNEILNKIRHLWSSRGKFGAQLKQNADYLIKSLGPLVCISFLALLLTPILTGNSKKMMLPKYVIGGFVVYYLFGISLITGLIERYVLILAPFILLYISIESYCLLYSIRRKPGGALFFYALYVFAIASMAYFQPKDFGDIEFYPKAEFQTASRLRDLQGQVPRGDFVMSQTPAASFLAGGRWHIMPNDSLERIHKFAARQGIHWLLVVQQLDVEVALHAKSRDWYMDPRLQERYSHLIELRATSEDNIAMLFRFKSD